MKFKLNINPLDLFMHFLMIVGLTTMIYVITGTLEYYFGVFITKLLFFEGLFFNRIKLYKGEMNYYKSLFDNYQWEREENINIEQLKNYKHKSIKHQPNMLTNKQVL